MIATLYQRMAIPESCHLGKRVFKKLFHENVKLGAIDKKAFREDIDTITWQYTLKPSTIQIHPYEDDQREYPEVAVLHVDLKTQKRTGRIAEIVHRAIPYPLLIIFAFDNMCALSAASKRFSQAEKEAIVAEDFVITDWIDLSVPTPVQKKFLASLAVAGLPHTHFFAFYTAIVDRLIALDCAQLTGEYRLGSLTNNREARRERLAVCHELEGKIAEYRAAIKEEVQFNRKVELNAKIDQLKRQLAQTVNALRQQ